MAETLTNLMGDEATRNMTMDQPYKMMVKESMSKIGIAESAGRLPDGNLETRAMRECLKMVLKTGLTVTDIVTDRNTSVAKVMREEFPTIKHHYGTWHMALNIMKKLILIKHATHWIEGNALSSSGVPAAPLDNGGALLGFPRISNPEILPPTDIPPFSISTAAHNPDRGLISRNKSRPII
eukprot:sb/3471660/